MLTGFDKNMGDNWIYPINYPMRDYQFNVNEVTHYFIVNHFKDLFRSLKQLFLIMFWWHYLLDWAKLSSQL